MALEIELVLTADPEPTLEPPRSVGDRPPTYAWYLAGLVFAWLKDLGGLEAIDTINRRKAGKLYGAIDNSNFYHSPVDPAVRSLMNVPFTMPDSELDARFVAQADERGLLLLIRSLPSF